MFALMTESFPTGVNLKLSQKDGKFIVSWNHDGKAHVVEGDNLATTIREAVQAVKAMRMQNGLV